MASMIPLRSARVSSPQPAQRSGLTALPPLSLYVHLPWCLVKCPYCDFNSHPLHGDPEPQQHEYLNALQADLEATLPLVWGRSVQSVFIGGGTPSLFPPRAIESLLAMIRARLRLAPDAEITLEANPGTFETGRFAAYAAAGVTRLSIGVQSFDDQLLRAIGRVHDGDQARRAVEEAARRFATFNVDLMYALPEQTPARFAADLRTALGFSPPHLSCYQLTLEPDTPFAKRPPPLPDDDAAAAMLDLIDAEAGASGLTRYEVSALARAGHRCRHNLNYWQFGDYIGIGAGAHGKLSFHDRILRQSRIRQPARYVAAALAGDAVDAQRELSVADLGFEFMLNALRLVDGVPAALFTERTGVSIAAIARPLREACDAGLLEPDPTVLRATALGARFLNDLQQHFL